MFVNKNTNKNKENVKNVQKLLNKLDGLAEDFKQKCVDCSLKKECEEIDKCLM